MRKSSLPSNIYITNSNITHLNQSEIITINPIFLPSTPNNNNNNNQLSNSVGNQRKKMEYKSDSGKKFSYAFELPSNTNMTLSQKALVSPKGKSSPRPVNFSKEYRSDVLSGPGFSTSCGTINLEEIKKNLKSRDILIKKTYSFEYQGINFDNGSDLQKKVIEFFNQPNTIKEFRQIFLSLVRATNDPQRTANDLFTVRNKVVVDSKESEEFYKILFILWEDSTTSDVFLEYLKLLFTQRDALDLLKCKEELDILQKHELFYKQSISLINVLEKGGAHHYAKLFAATVFKEKIEAFLKSERNELFKEEIVALINIIDDSKRVIAELMGVKSKVVDSEKTRAKFNNFIIFLWKKKATVGVFLQYLSYLDDKELVAFQKSKTFQKNTRKLIKHMVDGEAKLFKNSENAFAQMFATPLLEERVLTMLKKKKYTKELDPVFIDLITTVKDRRWAANELIKIRKELNTGKSSSKFYNFLFLLWENRATVDVFLQYLTFANKADYEGLVKRSEFQENPLYYIDLLAHIEIPEKLDPLILIRGSCETKYFALDLLNKKMSVLYQELEAFLPKNGEITLEQTENCLNKIYYSKETVMRTLPRDVVLLLEKIRMRFKFNENYGDGVGLGQAAELLFFSGIIFHLGMESGLASPQIAPLRLIATELTNRLSGKYSDNVISKESPFRPLLDKFEHVHREFMEKNSNYGAAFLGELIFQDVEIEQEEREIDD
ncbi:MAG: hypothetical protein V4494_03470 [Chlamydiota bacterium]